MFYCFINKTKNLTYLQNIWFKKIDLLNRMVLIKELKFSTKVCFYILAAPTCSSNGSFTNNLADGFTKLETVLNFSYNYTLPSF